MANQHDPSYRVRVLSTYLNLKDTTSRPDIARQLGLTPSALKNYLDRVGTDPEGALQSAREELACEDRLAAEAARARQDATSQEQARQLFNEREGLSVSWGRFGRYLRRAAETGLDGSTPASVPQGQVVKGLSTLHTLNPETGEMQQRAVWTKTRTDVGTHEIHLRSLALELSTRIPRADPISTPLPRRSELCGVLTIADAHLGALAVMSETGNVWKLRVAEQVLRAAIDYLVRRCPPVDRLYLVWLGDTQDYENLIAETTESRHRLDSDSRFHEIIRTTIRVQKYARERVLETFPEVYELDVEANHDRASSILRGEMVAAHYEREPRLTVMRNDLPYHVSQWGDVMLGWHHGDLTNPGKLPSVFADEFAQIWGATKFRFIHHGHYHRASEAKASVEGRGADVIGHPTLAGRNAWASRSGLKSMRRARLYLYHKNAGEAGMVSVSPDALDLEDKETLE